MDLGLTRQEVAWTLGAWDQALRNWESGDTRPGPKHLPKIEAFLGATSIRPGDTLGERLLAWRKAHRVSKARAGRLTGLHEQTIAHLERGRGRWISAKVRGAVERLLETRNR